MSIVPTRLFVQLYFSRQFTFAHTKLFDFLILTWTARLHLYLADPPIYLV
jgi:hypothetical protein